MKLFLVALCLTLLNVPRIVFADDANSGAVEKEQLQLTKAALKAGGSVKIKTESTPKNKNENGETDDEDGDDDTENDGQSKNKNGDDGTGNDGESSDENGDEDDIKSTKNTVAKSEKDKNKEKITPKEDILQSKHDAIIATAETPELLEKPVHDDNTNSDNAHVFIETSKNVTAQLFNAISGIATTNITMDAWKNQSWANKTPREVVDLLEGELTIMFHDKYVHFVFITMSITSIIFTLYVVNQIVENPKGILSTFCRCTVACLRIVCCPIYTILCCPCCSTKKNRHSTKEYSHLPTHETHDSKSN